MSEIIATHASNRDARDHAIRLNAERENDEAYGCHRTNDGRWLVIRVAINAERPS